MIKKRKIALLIVLICILICLKVFAFTYLGNIAKLTGFILSTAGLAAFVLYFRKFPKVFRFFGVLFIILFMNSVLSTYLIHGQAIKKGVIASIDMYLIGMSYLAYYLILRFKLTLPEIKRKILQISWALFALYILIFIFDIRFALIPGEEGFGIESINKSLVTLASIIYLTEFYQKNNSKYLLFSMLLFSTHQYADFQRYIMFVYVMCFVALIVHFGKRKVVIKTLVSLGIIIPLVLVVLTTTNFGASVRKKMSDAMEIFDEDKDRFTESSIEARVWQINAAMESIEKHPISGVGRIHNSKTEQVLGMSYFYVSDIGLLGVMFSYGLFGIFIFLRQILYLYRGYRQRSDTGKIQFIGYKYFLLFIILHSIINGRCINMPQEFMMMIALIELEKAHYKTKLKQSHEKA